MVRMTYREEVRGFLMNTILIGSKRSIRVNDDDSLVGSGLISSLSIVEIIGYIEKRFGLDVADEGIDITDFDSVDSICRLIERKGATPQALQQQG